MNIKESVRARLAIAFSKATSHLLRQLGLGEGATVPGRILLAIYPGALKSLSGSFPKILISGTNAKTTTTALAYAGLTDRYQVVSNVTGANMEAGIAFALAERDFTSDEEVVGLFEVDEGYLPLVGEQIGVDIVALLNLSRDQLDRVSETRMTSAKWREFLEHRTLTVVANCDDPLIVFAAEVAREVIWVGAGLAFKADAQSCPKCGGMIDFGALSWSCSCGFSRPSPRVIIVDEGVSVGGEIIPLHLQLPGHCNVANASMALAICSALDVDLRRAADRMEAVNEVAGRYKRVEIEGRKVRMLLSKNPAGWYEIFDLVGDDPCVVVSINSRIADGRDPSWLWDVPFEKLAGRQVFAAGERALDLSVRLLYAGVPHEVIVDPYEAIKRCNSITVAFVGNYTAFQEFRREISGAVPSVYSKGLELLHRVVK